MSEEIKITHTGKVSIKISASLKPFLLHLLETFMEYLRDESKGYGPMLTIPGCEVRIYLSLIDEVYCKYHTQLSIISRDGKIMLSLAQAYALWELCQSYHQEALANAEMGYLLMELHRKLSA